MNKWTLSDVAKHWDEALDYDDINERTYSYSRRFIDGYRLFDVKDGSYILDICCRTGNGTLFFGSRKKKSKFMCIDPSTLMLSIAEKRLKKEKINFQIKKMDSLVLPFKENTFDYILCFETLEHMPNTLTFLSELNRVLKKKGRLVLTTPNTIWEPIHFFAALFKIHHGEGPHKFLSRRKIVKYLRNNKFDISKEKTTVLIPYGPKSLIRIGEFFEKLFKDNLMNLIGLRRIFVCEKR